MEVFLFRRGDKGIEYLLLKRVPQLGGYWQPITGSAEPHENPREAALREAREEAGVHPAARLWGPVYRFHFEKQGTTFEEHVFGLEVGDESVALGNEHSELKWCNYEDALAALKWESNREGLRRLQAELIRHR